MLTASTIREYAAIWTAGNNAGRGFAPAGDSVDAAAEALAADGGEVLRAQPSTDDIAVVRTAKGALVGIGGDAHGNGAWAVELEPAAGSRTLRTDIDVTAALDEFEFGETGSAKVESGGLYARREENADWQLLGSVADSDAAEEEVDAFFDRPEAPPTVVVGDVLREFVGDECERDELSAYVSVAVTVNGASNHVGTMVGVRPSEQESARASGCGASGPFLGTWQEERADLEGLTDAQREAVKAALYEARARLWSEVEALRA